MYAAIGFISIILSVIVIFIREIVVDFVFIISAPSDGIVIEVFAEESGDIIAESVVIHIVHCLAHDVVKLRLGLRREAPYMQLGEHIHIVVFLAIDVISIGVPIPVQVPEIHVRRHAPIHGVPHSAIYSTLGNDLIIAAKYHIFKEFRRIAPRSVSINEEIAQLFRIIRSVIICIDEVRGINAVLTPLLVRQVA